MPYIVSFLALTASNYFWQALVGHDWGVATERSLFQGFAVLGVYIAGKLTKTT
jgi:hypothetical protein